MTASQWENALWNQGVSLMPFRRFGLPATDIELWIPKISAPFPRILLEDRSAYRCGINSSTTKVCLRSPMHVATHIKVFQSRYRSRSPCPFSLRNTVLITLYELESACVKFRGQSPMPLQRARGREGENCLLFYSAPRREFKYSKNK